MLRASFTAADGTPVEDYVGEAGGAWTALTPGGVIEGGAMTGSVGAAPVYQSAAVPASADYAASFTVTPSAYDSVPAGGMAFLAGRATPGVTDTGYMLEVQGDGSQYWLSLAVGGGADTTMALGTLASGSYALTLDMRGSSISAYAQRTQDGRWLRQDGTWFASRVAAITLNDATYAAPGVVQIGGAW